MGQIQAVNAVMCHYQYGPVSFLGADVAKKVIHPVYKLLACLTRTPSLSDSRVSHPVFPKGWSFGNKLFLGLPFPPAKIDFNEAFVPDHLLVSSHKLRRFISSLQCGSIYPIKR